MLFYFLQARYTFTRMPNFGRYVPKLAARGAEVSWQSANFGT